MIAQLVIPNVRKVDVMEVNLFRLEDYILTLKENVKGGVRYLRHNESPNLEVHFNRLNGDGVFKVSDFNWYMDFTKVNGKKLLEEFDDSSEDFEKLNFFREKTEEFLVDVEDFTKNGGTLFEVSVH
jgi:hypothetical protein